LLSSNPPPSSGRLMSFRLPFHPGVTHIRLNTTARTANLLQECYMHVRASVATASPCASALHCDCSDRVAHARPVTMVRSFTGKGTGSILHPSGGGETHPGTLSSRSGYGDTSRQARLKPIYTHILCRHDTRYSQQASIKK